MAQFDPTKMAAFRGDEDSASPTTIIFKQMQAAGIPLNAGNIKQFMERIRSSPDTPGQIDKAAGGNFDYETGGSSQDRPAALRVERGQDDTPQPTDAARAPRGAVTPVDTRSGDQREAANAPKNTSAQPTSVSSAPAIDPATGMTPGYDPAVGAVAGGNDPMSGAGKMGLGALILGLGHAGLGALDRGIAGIRGSASPLVPSGPPATPDVGPKVTIPPTVPPVAPEPTPMESAMLKATAPPANPRLNLTGISGGMSVNPALTAAGAQNEVGILTGERPPPMMPPLSSNPATRVPDANVTVRPPAIRTEPGRAPLYIRPRIPPIRVVP